MNVERLSALLAAKLHMMDLAIDVVVDPELSTLSIPVEYFRSLIEKGEVHIPTYPSVALRISQIVQANRFTLGSLEAAVKAEPAVSASVLRLANSVFYGRGSKTDTLKQAIMRIGVSKLSVIALTTSLAHTSPRVEALSELGRTCWRNALASALLCQSLADVRKLNPDLCFTSGLLHDLGNIVAIGTLDAALQTPLRDRLLQSSWSEILWRYHVELGAMIAAKWQLSPTIEEVIERHHSSDLSGCQHPELVMVVAASDRVVALMNKATGNEPVVVDPISSGLSDRECKLVNDLIPNVRAAIDAFDSAPPSGGPLRAS
jgi:HD-like signal output (HDOD) protein